MIEKLDINAALKEFHEEHGLDDGDYNNVARTRVLLTRVTSYFIELRNALDEADWQGLTRTLAKFDRIDHRHPGTTVEDVLGDVADISDAALRHL